MPRILITVPEKNAQPYRFSLDRRSVSIGRGSENDIVIDSGSVSVQHAEMRRVEGGYELVDVGSTNGIKLLGVRHDHVALVSGMSLKLGEVAFDFTLTDEEHQAISHERPTSDNPSHVKAVTEKLMEETPRQKPRPVSTAKPIPEAVGVSFGMIVLFLLLAAAAFAVGLSIRHHKETGETLIKAMINKGDRVEKTIPAVENPAK